MEALIALSFPENSFLHVDSPPTRSELHLSNRKQIVEGLLYPESYFPCSCCHSDGCNKGNGQTGKASNAFSRPIQSSQDDLGILYGLFKDWPKSVSVDDAKKAFFGVFLKENKKADQEVVEARFWCSVRSLEFMGMVALDENETKLTKLDFAL